MKERPILFSAPMVRAVLAGTKTQTRRAIRLPHMNPLGEWQATTSGGANGGRTRSGETIPFQGSIWHTRTGDSLLCPFGAPGEHFWVREAWKPVHSGDPSRGAKYRADVEGLDQTLWKPSIHMPRWASRITLEIVDVRAQRLADISDADALAEGIELAPGRVQDDSPPLYCHTPSMLFASPPEAFWDLWRVLYGMASVKSNPWLWAVTFKRAA